MEFNNTITQKQPAPVSVLGKFPGTKTAIQEWKPVKFVFPAIRADKISVAGTFNNWTPGVFTLKKDTVGVWRGALYLKSGTYQYRFDVDGRWVNDPGAKNKVPNEFGTMNTVLEVK